MVIGVGAVEVPVPPVAVVYQFRVLPGKVLAVKGTAVVPMQ